MDVAHTILAGLVVALGMFVVGKSIGGKDKVPTTFCNQKHAALNALLEEKFTNLIEKVDTLIVKVDKINSLEEVLRARKEGFKSFIDDLP